ISGFAPATIHYSAAGNFNNPANSPVIGRMSRSGCNRGGNTFNVRSTLAGSTTDIDGDATSDTYNVSSDAATNDGNLAGIQGTLTVQGGSGSNNRLIVSDFGATGSNTAVTVTNNSISGFAPATIFYSAAGNFNNPATSP